MGRAVLLTLILALAVVGCRDLLVEPAPRPTHLAFALGLDDTGGEAADLTGVFDQVTRVRVVISRTGKADVIAEQPFNPSQSTTLIPVTVPNVDTDEPAHLLIELFSERGRLFRITRDLILNPGDSTVDDLSLVPAVASLRIGGGEDLRFTTIGETRQLTVEAFFETGESVPGISPIWSSTPSGVVTVDANGLVTAVGPGTTSIRAAIGSVVSEITATVEQRIESIEIQPASARVVVDGTTQLVAVMRDAGGSPVAGRTADSWASSNPRAASIDANGLVTGIEPGETIITVEADGKSAKGLVTVVQGATFDLDRTMVEWKVGHLVSAPPAQVSILNSGPNELTGIAVASVLYESDPKGWLSTSLSSSSAPAVLTLTPASSTLPPGIYKARVALTSPDAPRPVEIEVVLHVDSRPGLLLEPASVDLVIRHGEENPPPIIQLRSSGATEIEGLEIGEIEYEGDVLPWLAFDLSDTRTPAELSVYPATSNLSPGRHVATVPIKSPDLAAPALLTVSVDVSEPAEIILSPPEVQIEGWVDEFIDPFMIEVTGGNGVSLSGIHLGEISYWDDPTGWLTATVDQAESPARITVEVDESMLPAGTFVATVEVWANETPEPVFLTVRVAMLWRPEIWLGNSTAEFEWMGGDPPVPVEIAIDRIGPGDLTDLKLGPVIYEAGPSGWLEATLGSSTAPTTLTLSANPIGLTNGLHSAVVPIISTVAMNSPREVTVEFIVEADACDLIAGSLTPDQTVNAILTADACFIFDDGYYWGKRWNLVVPNATTVTLSMSSAEIDPFLRLEDFEGNWITSNDDFGLGFDSRIVATLDPGTYRLWAMGLEQEIGAYTLSAKTFDPCTDPVGELSTLVDFGDLDASDCVLDLRPGGPFAEKWVFTLNNPATFEVQLTSEDFDAYLVITDSNGVIIGEDDNSHFGTNASVSFIDLEPGVYSVWVTSATAGETGDYQVGIQPSL